jgi:hypothetical protein
MSERAVQKLESTKEKLHEDNKVTTSVDHKQNGQVFSKQCYRHDMVRAFFRRGLLREAGGQ